MSIETKEKDLKVKEPNKFKLVHVNMAETTLNKIAEVKNRLHADNKTTAIRYSIEIADIITDVIERGGKVILEEDGKQYIMKIPGIKKSS